ncbi:hypothetical protein FGO68_gene7208 [Halteria grandinella]|uniref:HMG box domain-containing protein n=1 Tax=Halteria grandinella TaxID=5974 RepID=A0A8J8T1N0_HALGN|nr:hypothetical protein FGO68_gene7208 [Halteria grandinella]
MAAADAEEDIIKPTRPLSAYIFFSTERTKEIKATGKTQIEAMRQCGVEWNALTEEQKAPFLAKNKEDEKRYLAQQQEVKDKGYFIMKDGTKSTDHTLQSSTRKRKSAGVVVNSPANKTKGPLTAGKAKAK